MIPLKQSCNPTSTPYQIGDIWEMDIKKRLNLKAPHLEDCDVLKRKKIGSVPDLNGWLRNVTAPWNGEPSNLFDGAIKFRSSGSAYVSESGSLPSCSTGFWIVPRILEYCPFIDDQSIEHPRYVLSGSERLVLPYVGFDPPLKAIDARTLVRLSLSRAWTNAPEHLKEERDRHSVQLSGWY